MAVEWFLRPLDCGNVPAQPRGGRARPSSDFGPGGAARVHFGQQGRSGRPRHPDRWLHHSVADADGFPDLGEPFHRALPRRFARLHHHHEPRLRRQPQRLYRPDGARDDVRRGLVARAGLSFGRKYQVDAGLRSLSRPCDGRANPRRAAWRSRPVDSLPHRFVECRPALSHRARHSLADRCHPRARGRGCDRFSQRAA